MYSWASSLFILIFLFFAIMTFLKVLSKSNVILLKFFDLIYNMTQGGPNHQTDVFATHLYFQGFQYFKYGYASAISVVLLILCLIVSFVINKCIKVETYES